MNDDALMALCIFGLVTSGVGFTLVMSSLEWLQILVAPKLYLLEYARVLVMR